MSSALQRAAEGANRDLDQVWRSQAEHEAALSEREQARIRIRRDPVWFCRFVLGWEPWSKQREILESVRDHKRTAVRSCHGVGKTADAAAAVLWFLAAYPRSRVITTAPTWAQVKEQLWREIAVRHESASGWVKGQLSDTRLELGPDWFAIGLSTDKPERFQGQHAAHLLLVVDEASGVSQPIFDAAEGFLTSEGARVLLIGNPTQLAGEFYDAFHRNRALWNTIQISAFDSPAFTGEPVSEQVLGALVSREWVAEKREKWGERSPLWQVRVLGEFPSTSENTVASLAAVEEAQRRFRDEQVRGATRRPPVVVACDVARFGSDETVIAVRFGDRAEIRDVYQGRDTMETVGRVVRAVRYAREAGNDFPRIVVDDVGVGGGVTDRLRELRREHVLEPEVRVVAFNAAAAAASRDYPNRRSELWFEFADRHLPTVALETDEQLAADLLAPTYSIDSRGRRVVEAKERTKERLGRSPDRADAVLMLFATDAGPLPEAVVTGRRGRAAGVVEPAVTYGRSL